MNGNDKRKIKTGIAWYREDQWLLLKSTAFDSGTMEDTFQEWLQHANETMRKLKSQGLNPVKVDFDVHEFNNWCKSNNRVSDGRSRADYAAYLLQKEEIVHIHSPDNFRLALVNIGTRFSPSVDPNCMPIHSRRSRRKNLQNLT